MPTIRPDQHPNIEISITPANVGIVRGIRGTDADFWLWLKQHWGEILEYFQAKKIHRWRHLSPSGEYLSPLLLSQSASGSGSGSELMSKNGQSRNRIDA